MQGYEFLERCGSGTYGSCVKVRERGGNTLRCIKVFQEAQKNAEMLRHAAREVKWLKLLSGHPNIVHLHEAYRTEKQNVYLVMEYMPYSLSAVLRHNCTGISPDRVKHMMRQLLAAIAHMHDMKVMHRDVKPANILLDEKDNLKLCDFGFARSLPGFTPTSTSEMTTQQEGSAPSPSHASSRTPLTPYVVTRWYRAPELLVGDEYGEGVDVWAAGCILWELLTGSPLLPGSSHLDQLGLTLQCFGALTPRQMRAMEENLDWSVDFTPQHCPRLQDRLLVTPGLNQPMAAVLLAALQVDPALRPSAKQLLSMPFFTMEDVPASPRDVLLQDEEGARHVPGMAIDGTCNAESDTLVMLRGSCEEGARQAPGGEFMDSLFHREGLRPHLGLRNAGLFSPMNHSSGTLTLSGPLTSSSVRYSLMSLPQSEVRFSLTSQHHSEGPPTSTPHLHHSQASIPSSNCSLHTSLSSAQMAAATEPHPLNAYHPAQAQHLHGTSFSMTNIDPRAADGIDGMPRMRSITYANLTSGQGCKKDPSVHNSLAQPPSSSGEARVVPRAPGLHSGPSTSQSQPRPSSSVPPHQEAGGLGRGSSSDTGGVAALAAAAAAVAGTGAVSVHSSALSSVLKRFLKLKKSTHEVAQQQQQRQQQAVLPHEPPQVPARQRPQLGLPELQPRRSPLATRPLSGSMPQSRPTAVQTIREEAEAASGKRSRGDSLARCTSSAPQTLAKVDPQALTGSESPLRSTTTGCDQPATVVGGAPDGSGAGQADAMLQPAPPARNEPWDVMMM